MVEQISTPKNFMVEQIATPRNSMVEQIVTHRNFIVNLDLASVDNEFLGVTICSTTLSAMCYLYIIKFIVKIGTFS